MACLLDPEERAAAWGVLRRGRTAEAARDAAGIAEPSTITTEVAG
jgi:hypothetical protein